MSSLSFVISAYSVVLRILSLTQTTNLDGKTCSHRKKKCAYIERNVDEYFSQPCLYSPFIRICGTMLAKYCECSWNTFYSSKTSTTGKFLGFSYLWCVRNAFQSCLYCFRTCKNLWMKLSSV